MEQNRMGYIVVDEFSALGGSLLQSLFERARSNGGAVTLATQVSTALEEASMSFKDSVIKNSNVKVLHQQDTNAEEYAGLIGTEKGMAETTQIFDDKDELGMTTRASGQGSLREVEQFRVHPNELRDLEPGQAIIFTKTPAVQHRVKVRRMTASGGRVELPRAEGRAPARGTDAGRGRRFGSRSLRGNCQTTAGARVGCRSSPRQDRYRREVRGYPQGQ
ncbi:TraM recognition domain-containing protein [Arthrobacter sp. SD76]|uniref:TraM recognition domain-containing protein n=1 Tax=Arthrobacter sp. SD76 TaxID=3415007 RepID=UPI003C72A425